MNTRATAASIFLRIRDDGAYSNVLLPQATRRMSAEDRSFVYSLVTTALRNQRTIEATVEAATNRKLTELDDEVAAILSIAVGELLAGSREAIYATVNESVDAIKQLGNPRASGLVNGVLRTIGREGLPELPTDRAQGFSVPEWVLGQITQDHGRGAAGELLRGLRRPTPGVAVRVRPGGEAPADAVGIDGIGDAYRLAAPPESLEGLAVADAASVAVARAVGVQRGERVLDMAAAPGGKTMTLWDEVDGALDLVAMDSHRRRLQSARDRLTGVGVEPRWVAGDGQRAPFADGSFDAVLLDAPCTGLGTLRRRPEIAMRLTTRGLAALAETQRAMLAEAWRLTRAGGRVVYSVCTLFAAETVDIVADYDATAPEGLPGQKWGDGLLLAPHLTDTDGMFISVISR